MDARIGQLSNGKFYAFVNGYNKPETVGSLEQVEVALGLRQESVQQAAISPVRASLKEYIVTITPKYKAYCGSWQSEEYAVTVYAKDANDAVKKARKGYMEDNQDNPATYRAKVVK